MGKTTEALPEDDFLIKELQKGGRPTDLMTVAELRSLREHVDKMIDILDKDEEADFDFAGLPEWLRIAKILRG